jgi:type IV pilus assembly protein PilP
MTSTVLPRAPRFLAALAALALASLGCDDGAPPAPEQAGSEAPAAEGSASEGGAADPSTPPPAPEENGASDDTEMAYVYSPIGKRDPFRSLFDKFQQGPETEELTELQKFELDQLKLVGIVSRIPTPYALVEDPDGKGHSIRRGTFIGKNWGRVSAITPDCVIIKEEYREYTGRKVTNKTDMCIPKPADLELD